MAILGGKVRFLSCLQLPSNTLTDSQAGGKVDGAQGVGINTDKINDALQIAEKFYNEKMSS